MNKLIQKLINWLWQRYTFEGLQKEIQDIHSKIPIKYKYDVLTLIERLESAGWHKIGTERNANQEIWMFDTVDQSIQVHIHNEGDLYRVYRQVNDMNINSLIARLIEPNRHLEQAKQHLNIIIKDLNNNDSLNGHPAQNIPDVYQNIIRRAMAALMAME